MRGVCLYVDFRISKNHQSLHNKQHMAPHSLLTKSMDPGPGDPDPGPRTWIRVQACTWLRGPGPGGPVNLRDVADMRVFKNKYIHIYRERERVVFHRNGYQKQHIQVDAVVNNVFAFGTSRSMYVYKSYKQTLHLLLVAGARKVQLPYYCKEISLEVQNEKRSQI